ncbi:MAG: hypothetical protein DMG58_16920 [Acidobacteria bacterium]|nr:MAG: hypothetical protein DMG58_16920 [Acidobacteriota bacterium]
MHSICKVAPHWFTCTIFREVLEGDRLSVELDVRPSARAQVTSTGATRLYRSRPEAEPAEFTMYVRAHEGALLEYLPDPLIPFAGSRYRQRTVVNLEHDAGLFWWDTVAPGREARGEVFSYHHLHLSFALRVDGIPVAIERGDLDPIARPLQSAARLGPYRYFSTFYVCTYEVRADGELLTCEPASVLPLAQRYFLF